MKTSPPIAARPNPIAARARPTNREGEPHPISDRAGKNMDDWPEELRVREWPL